MKIITFLYFCVVEVCIIAKAIINKKQQSKGDVVDEKKLEFHLLSVTFYVECNLVIV